MPKRYLPHMDSIRTHTVPQWYSDSKFGIFIHWGIYSVPAWAYPSGRLGSIPFDERWYAYNPYAEWYCNTVRCGFGPSYEHHIKTYGKDFDYEDFADLFLAENWNPDEWAELFKASGARYVIPTTKHHDGFCLWNTKYTDFNAFQRGPKRDLITDLCRSVRSQGLRFGVYYSGMLNWHVTNNVMLSDYEVHHPENCTYEYADFAYKQMLELIDCYHPDILWNDLDWPLKGLDDLPYLFAHYYNAVPDGVTNDRWHDVWHDYKTKEYDSGKKLLDEKWECCQGMGLSFGYNQVEDLSGMMSSNELLQLLIDTVAFNGNLLLNVGPKADGTIPNSQKERLQDIGKWLGVYGKAIYNTTPYDRQKEALPTGETLYYTQTPSSVFLLIVNPKAGQSTLSFPALPLSSAHMKSLGNIPAFLKNDNGIWHLTMKNIPQNSAPVVFEFTKG
ncbi:MAG: alpha-L-fucosidase [Eubacteriales bacterium]|nr:alpha-L-fucosidase [Eubacteriales bacterium]